MADIALRKYLEQIDSLVDQKQLDEAVAHCKNILSFYPKSLDTYRALGKALLEKSRHGDAADIFQRILSAVPDDFVAHVGMSIVREDEANLDAALWHMERAFESNPSNAAIQEELRRLYGRRDGVVPARARLTRGALARMYYRGGLYPQAEAELRAALGEDPARLDLQTVLAQTLFEAERRPEAADVCMHVLEMLPYSLEANRILAQILASQNRHDEARQYRQRLEALDPYEAHADGAGAQAVNPDAVRVPELVVAPDFGEGRTAATPEWAESLGEKIETPFGEPSAEASFGDLFGEPETAEPDWLRKGTGSLTAEPTAVTGGDLPAAGEVPDWMKDIQPVSAPETPTELPDWMKTGSLGGEPPTRKTGSRLTDRLNKAQPPPEAAPTEALTPGEMPDWMKAAAPTFAEQTPAAETPDWMKTGMLGGETPAAEPMPDWMRSDEGETTALPWLQTTAPEGAATGQSVPEWLKGSEQVVPSAEAVSPTELLSGGETPNLDELPTWMRESAGGQTIALSADEAEATPADSLPDWLKAGAAGAALGGAAALAAEPAPAEALPEWMKTQPEAEPSPEAEALPDWMKTQPEAETPSAEPGALPDWLAAAAPTGEAALPDWMQAQPETPAPSPTPAVELPDFLQPATEESIDRANQPVQWEEEAAPEAVATPDDSGVPDWIKAMAPDPNAPPPQRDEDNLPPVDAEELPDWLKAGAAEAAPSQPLPGPAVEAVPDWLQAAEPMAEAPAAAPAEELPDWLKAVEVTPAIEPIASAPADVAEAVPDLSAMSADEAMRWLEGLAAKQGAAPEELITSPEERTETPPAWLAAGAPAETPAPTPAEELPLPPADLPPWVQTTEPGASDTVGTWLADKKVPEWMRQPGEASAAPPSDWLRAPMEQARPEEPEGEPALPDWLSGAAPPHPAAPAQPPQTEAAPAAEADFASMSADEAMRWLEGLAAKQGAAPEELITKPEERLETPPDWLTTSAEEPASFAAPVEPEAALAAPSLAEEMPEWLKGAAPPEEPTSFAAPAEAAPTEAAEPDLSAMSADEAMRWLEGLAARQGAAPEELITKPEERLETPPAWVETPRTGGPIMPPTGVLPDIFHVGSTAPPPEAAQPVEEPAGPEAVPDLSAMSADEAMRWLEGLAAKQGAAPEELITKPEERLEAPPDWLAAVPEGGAVEQAAPPAAEENITPVPSWLAGYPAEETTEAPAWLRHAQEEPAAPAPEAAPDLGAMEADEAMRWLEGLAAKQGAAPEELTTKPEERVEAPPAWVAAQAEEPEPAPEPEAGLPDWIRAADEAQAAAPTAETSDELPEWIRAMAETPPVSDAPPPPVAETPRAAPPRAEAPQPAPSADDRRSDERLARLAERLAASKRAKEDEVATRLERQRQERDAAMREVAQRMEERRRPTPGTGPLRPGTGRLRPPPEAEPATPEAAPAATAPLVPETAPAQPAAEKPAPRRATSRLVVPARITRKKARAKSPFAGQLPADVFSMSRQQLIEGQYDQAADGFGYLVSKGHLVNEVVIELELFTSSHPSSVPVMFSVLGDAYMKSNQMQKALDAYRQALTQM
jgi:tetratricopeptide (TPR) repeat protein